MKRLETEIPLIKRRTFLAAALTTPLFLNGDEKRLPKVPEQKEIKQTVDLLQGNWDVMPGVERTATGLHVTPTHFSLVEQDGTFAQENPPINFGTYIKNVKGDFAIRAKIDVQKSKEARLQFYGTPPIVADEFRIERGNLQLALSEGKLNVKLWDGTHREDPDQKPNIEKTFLIPLKKTAEVIMVRRKNELLFNVNGAPVGRMNENGIFDSGELFLGLDSTDKTWELKNLDAAGITDDTLTMQDATKEKMKMHDLRGLQILAHDKRPDFTVGMARAVNPMFADQEYQDIALDKDMFGSMTPENAMKMINLQPKRGVYTFEQADALVKLAQDNGISVHGHTLVFAEANPLWFNALEDPTEIKNVMIDHISTVVGHYKGKVKSWDVINEPLDETDDGKIILREHKWKEALGDEYIMTALETAHSSDPDAMLFINEYGLEADGDRWNAFLSLMKKLKPQLTERGIPIDKIGVGFQAHVFGRDDKITPETLKKHIQQLGELGFKTQISEMDVYSDDGDDVQAKQYADVFKVALEEPTCVAWRGWILSDRYDYWKDDEDNNTIKQGADGLYDKEMKPRPALRAMQQVIK